MSRASLTIDAIDRNADDEVVATLVADTGVSVVVPVAMLPAGAREGDVLAITLERDEVETEARRSRVKDLQKQLFG